jgi:hypothetical protein
MLQNTNIFRGNSSTEVFYIIKKLMLKNGMIANNYTGDARGHLKTNSKKNQMRISGFRHMSKPHQQHPHT